MSISPLETTPARKVLRLPPEVPSLPLVGALPNLVRQRFDFLLQARERYGDIYAVNVAGKRYVVMHHPRQTEHVFLNNAHNYPKGGGVWDALRTLMGNGLVVSEGEFWLRQRRMMQPHFHRQRLAALTAVMAETTTHAMRAWEPRLAADGSFDIQRGFSAATLQVVTRALFGRAVEQETIDLVADRIGQVFDHIGIINLLVSLPPWAPIPGARRFRESMGVVNRAVPEIIRRERSAAEPSDSLLAMLIQMVDADTGEGMTDAQLRDEVMTMFLAGYETTSLALTWAVAFLAQHPHVLARMQAEVDSVLAGRAPTFADLAQLNYTRMVLYESMRLRPPSWWVPRTAKADDVIDGYDIPAGTTVVSFTYGIHHHPALWEHPERFDPERFTPERSADRHRLAWVPFGTGQRQCIGRDFAIMEGQVILATLLQHFELTPLPNTSVEPAFSGMTRPKNPPVVRLRPRA